MVLTFFDLAALRLVVFGTVPISLLDTKAFWCRDLKQLDQYLMVMVDSSCGGLGKMGLVEHYLLFFSCVSPAAEALRCIRFFSWMMRYCLSFACLDQKKILGFL